jgi:hypothetical protein
MILRADQGGWITDEMQQTMQDANHSFSNIGVSQVWPSTRSIEGLRKLQRAGDLPREKGSLSRSGYCGEVNQEGKTTSVVLHYT